MSRFLVAYATTDGHTALVAQRIAGALRDDGHEVDVFSGPALGDDLMPDRYHGVMIAGSIHGGRHQRSIARWTKRHHRALNRLPTALFTVCLAVRDPRSEARAELARIVDDLILSTGWRPTIRQNVAGALLYTKYNWLKRFLMKRIVAKAGGDTDTSRDYVYTDWDELEATARMVARMAMTQERHPGSEPSATIAPMASLSPKAVVATSVSL